MCYNAATSSGVALRFFLVYFSIVISIRKKKIQLARSVVAKNNNNNNNNNNKTKANKQTTLRYFVLR